MLDTKAIATALAPIVKSHVAEATAPLIARIAELEKRQPEPGKDGRDGAPVTDEQIAAAVTAYFDANPVPTPENGKDGQDADPEVVAQMVSEHVERAVATIPVPADGKSVTSADVEPFLRGLVEEAADSLRAAQTEAVECAIREAKMLLLKDIEENSAERRSMSDLDFLSRASLALGKQLELRQ